jgi:thymidine kinase
MNAGKSTKLLQSSFNYMEKGMNTLVYTASFDTRFGKLGCISSRIGLSTDANLFDSDLDFYDDVLSKKVKNLSCVLIDEAQFMTKKQVQDVCRIVDQQDIPVLAYGLRSDFRGEAFEGSMYLLLLADELVEIKTICHCGKKATMNARFGSDKKIQRTGEQLEIGGNEKYVSLCRKHYMEGKLS